MQVAGVHLECTRGPGPVALVAGQGLGDGEPLAGIHGIAQGALGVACFIDGVDVIVTVAIPAPVMLERVASWSGREAPAIAGTARAGPASG